MTSLLSKLFSGEQSASNSASDDTEIVCENGVCYKRPKDKTNPSTETAAATTTEQVDAAAQQLSNEEKLERAKVLLEKKRKEKEEESERVSEVVLIASAENLVIDE